jgi:tRNA-2-methylthio-N6-dimethylallyladenosine synthase
MVDAVEGIDRVRYTSPHPKDMREDVIRAHAELPALCEHIHLPLQSGSSTVLKRMRRTYNRERYMDRVALIREHVPDCALTTDIIVGFPGETEVDFQATLEVVEQARFSQAFTFQYSPRPGTPAAALPGKLPKPVVQERYERLVRLCDRISWEENQAQVGRQLEVLVAAGEGSKDASTARMSGRARDNRLVHFATAPSDPPRPGDIVDVQITYAAPHHLLSDLTPVHVRRTRAGDAWDGGHGALTAAGDPGVSLGMPSLRHT